MGGRIAGSWPVVGVLVALSVWGGLLAAAGVVPGADSIVWYVFAIVDGIPADPVSLLKPIYNPPPMYTHAYRPLSTAVLKAGSALFGRDPGGLQVQTFLHGLVLLPYGLAAWRFGEAHGSDRRVAVAAALLSMALPTVLFSAWVLPEFDVLGGAFVLWAAAALRRGRWSHAVAPLLLAVLTKETTAALMLAWLLAWTSVSWPQGRRLPAGITLGFVGLLLLAVAPILATPPPSTHAFSVTDSRFSLGRVGALALHDLTQLVYSVGAAGCALVAVRAAAARRKMPGAWIPAAAAVVVLGQPVLRFYNHYEAVVATHPVWVGAAGLVLVGALSGLALSRDDDDAIRGRMVLLAGAALLAGPVLTGFSRADLSARLFAPVLPVVVSLALEGVALAWRRGRAEQAGAAVLGVVLASGVLFGTHNAVAAHRARFAAEAPAKAHLASTLTRGCPTVLATNRDHELALEELEQLGAQTAFSPDCALLIQLHRTATHDGDLFDREFQLNGHDQYRTFRSGAPLEAVFAANQRPADDLHLYLQGPRAAVSLPAEARPDRQLAWAAERMPEVQRSWLEQALGVAWVADTPLERWAASIADARHSEAAAYVQLPRTLAEVPRRLLTGQPLLERWTYRADQYTVRGAATAAATQGEPAP